MPLQGVNINKDDEWNFRIIRFSSRKIAMLRKDRIRELAEKAVHSAVKIDVAARFQYLISLTQYGLKLPTSGHDFESHGTISHARSPHALKANTAGRCTWQQGFRAVSARVARAFGC
eukprot:Gb_29673 [translate_table: standard]